MNSYRYKKSKSNESIIILNLNKEIVGIAYNDRNGNIRFNQTEEQKKEEKRKIYQKLKK